MKTMMRNRRRSAPMYALSGRSAARLALDANGEPVPGGFERAAGGPQAIGMLVEWAERNLGPEEIMALADALARVGVERQDAAAKEATARAGAFPEQSSVPVEQDRHLTRIANDSKATSSFAARHPHAAAILGLTGGRR